MLFITYYLVILTEINTDVSLAHYRLAAAQTHQHFYTAESHLYVVLDEVDHHSASRVTAIVCAFSVVSLHVDYFYLLCV